MRTKLEPIAETVFRPDVEKALSELGYAGRSELRIAELIAVVGHLEYTLTPTDLATWARDVKISTNLTIAVDRLPGLLAALEVRGMWKPTPSIHDAKKSVARLACEDPNVEHEVVRSFVGYDSRLLLQQLLAMGDAGDREGIIEVLKTRVSGSLIVGE